MSNLIISTKVCGISVKPTSNDTIFKIIIDFDNGRQHSFNFNRREGKSSLIHALKAIAINIQEDRELN